jgi:hypothetical protein
VKAPSASFDGILVGKQTIYFGTYHACSYPIYMVTTILALHPFLLPDVMSVGYHGSLFVITTDFVVHFQLSPPPQRPLYVIATSYAINSLLEYAEIEDLGLRQPKGVRFISAESLEHMIRAENDPERAEVL